MKNNQYADYSKYKIDMLSEQELIDLASTKLKEATKSTRRANKNIEGHLKLLGKRV